MVSLRDLSIAVVSAMVIGLEGGLALGQSTEEPAKAIVPQEASVVQESIGESAMIDANDPAFTEGYRTWDPAGRRLFQSDHEFDDFVAPVSNPVFAKDPRSNTGTFSFHQQLDAVYSCRRS